MRKVIFYSKGNSYYSTMIGLPFCVILFVVILILTINQWNNTKEMPDITYFLIWFGILIVYLFYASSKIKEIELFQDHIYSYSLFNHKKIYFSNITETSHIHSIITDSKEEPLIAIVFLDKNKYKTIVFDPTDIEVNSYKHHKEILNILNQVIEEYKQAIINNDTSPR